MPTEPSAFKKGVWRSVFAEQRPPAGRKETGNQKGNLSTPGGLCSCVEAPGTQAGKVLAVAPVTSGPSSHLRKGLQIHTAEGGCSHWPPLGTGQHRRLDFSQKAASFAPENPTFSCRQHPCRHTPPSHLCAGSIAPPLWPIRGEIPSWQRNYRLSWEKARLVLRLYWNPFIFSAALQKWVSPKERERGASPLQSCSYLGCSLQCRRGTTCLKQIRPR